MAPVLTAVTARRVSPNVGLSQRGESFQTLVSKTCLAVNIMAWKHVACLQKN